MTQRILWGSLVAFLIVLSMPLAYALEADLTWTYTAEPTHLATSFVVQRCTIVSPATVCSTFADLPAGVGLSIGTFTFQDTTILSNAVGYCYQVLDADAGGRSAASNVSCISMTTLIPRIDVAWDYAQEPTHLATSFVVQRCTMVSAATPCTTFADLSASLGLPMEFLAFHDTTISLSALGYCYQGLAADTGGRSTVSNSTCYEFAIVTPPGTMHPPWAMGMLFTR